MNSQLRYPSSQQWLATAALTLLLLANPHAHAGPGAHGPNGEHLDSPTAVRAASALPRLEAHTETFELVAELRAGELAIVVDRYESNEPVLGAKLEVESGSFKAVAAFRAEQGDYVVTDAALLKVLAGPGEHALVFTLVAGKDSDLLDGTMAISAAARDVSGTAKPGSGGDHGGDGHAHDHSLERTAWIGAAIAALGLLSGVAWWRQRRRDVGKLQGGL